MPFELQILGASSATPAWGRYLTSQILTVNNRLFMMDCGEGTQYQIVYHHIKLSKIERIFISHLHGDHFLGLPGLLYTMALNGRKQDLFLYGPSGLDETLTVQFRHGQAALPFKIRFHALDFSKPQQIVDEPTIEVHSFPVQHRIPCCGFLVKEKLKPRRIIGKKIPPNFENHLFDKLKNGEDVLHEGTLYKNETLTTSPKKSLSYAFCTDTVFLEDVIEQVRGVDLLYHEATFTESFADRAPETGHSTAFQAATIAKLAEVGKLIIGHFSTRYRHLDPFLEEAKSVFANTELAIEGRIFHLNDD